MSLNNPEQYLNENSDVAKSLNQSIGLGIGERPTIEVKGNRDELVANHPYIDHVSAAIQLAVTQQGGIGCQAQIGVPGEQVKNLVESGQMTHARIAEISMQKALHDLANQALNNKRIGRSARTEVLDGHGECGVLALDAVVFSNDQFAKFLLDVEKTVLLAIDTIIEERKHGDTEDDTRL